MSEFFAMSSRWPADDKPVQVTFRNLPVSPAIEDACLAQVAKLERYYNRITRCQVTVAESHRHHRKGNLYEIRIVLHVPGDELVVSRSPAAHQAAEDIYVVIRESFDRARRVLKDYVRRRRGQLKAHEEAPLGCVVRLIPEEGFGFLETADGREVYFHRNSVLCEGFDKLVVGSSVRFVEEAGEMGPQAASLMLAGPASS